VAKLLAVLGSVTPPGRMLSALKWTLQSGSSSGGSDFETDLINLADCRIAFADGRPPDKYEDDTGSVVARVGKADAVILASPVYRGSYTGALKNLLDHLPIEALAGKPVGIVAMGATNHHYLGVDWHLRDVLAWFGAVIVPTSVYLSSADFVEGNLSDGAKQDLTALVQALYKLKNISPAPGEYLGPRPLASRHG
jgi:FMN reductase